MMPFALSVLAHPGPQSFTHAMAQAAQAVLEQRGYTVAAHDLYAERFDPVQPNGEAQNTTSADALVELHCEQLARADLVLVFHPNWWGRRPERGRHPVKRTRRHMTPMSQPVMQVMRVVGVI